MHTPGTWSFDGTHVFGNNCRVATINNAIPDDEAKANGLLLASAPVLLDACERLLRAQVVHKFMPYRIRIAMDVARSAIAKAKGETP